MKINFKIRTKILKNYSKKNVIKKIMKKLVLINQYQKIKKNVNMMIFNK